MLRVISEIKIEQQPTKEFPTRNATYSCPFEASESSSSWKNLTDTLNVIFPKNVYYIDQAGKKVSWLDKTVVNSKTSPPLLLKGDKINVRLGYLYSKDFKGEAEVIYDDFFGYVAKITPDLSIKVQCEDEIWKLKQIKTPKKLFKQSEYDVNKMLKELVSSTDITVETGNIKTYVGDYRTNGETVAEVLTNLQKNYNLESGFIIKNGVKILRCSGIVYYPGERAEHVFQFEKNIISHDLEYSRKDDVKLGARAYSISSDELAQTNKDGTKKKRKKRLSVVVGETGGEFRTFYFFNIKSETELKALATAKMNRYYYEGYRGKFKVFGIPKVNHGDAVILQDKTMPERQGTYLVKSVTRTCNKDEGLVQELEIDIRIDTMSETDMANGL